MRLGQAAAALWVNEKTLDNAIRILGLSRPLDEDTVRALGLAFRAKYRYGIPLKRGFPAVREALKQPALRESDVVVRELMAYLPEVQRGIDRHEQQYKPLPRGPGWRDPYHPAVPARWRRHPAIRRAIWWGLDLSLNDWKARRPGGQLLLELGENLRAVRLLQKGDQAMTLVAMWECFVRDGVKFVVIGGVAATVHGSARITDDLDVCYDPAPDNTAKLVRLLNDWHARLHLPREPEARLPFVIDQRTFRDAPALTLITDHGRLDLLAHVTGIGDYAACLAVSEETEVDSVRLRVLTLAALIKAKRAAGRTRDHEHLIELEALHVLKQEQAKPPPRRPRRRR